MNYYTQTEWKTVRRKYQNSNLATSATANPNNAATNSNNHDIQVEMSHLEDSKDEEGSLKFRIDAMEQSMSPPL